MSASPLPTEGEPAPRMLMVMVTTFGAPIAWSLHLGVSYFLVALDCATAWNGSTVAIAVATVLFSASSLGAGALSYRLWRRTALRGGEGEQPLTTGRFLWLLGIMLAALFAPIIVLAGLSPAFVTVCG